MVLEVRRPSSMAKGRVRRLLEYIEQNNPNALYDGTSHKTWIACAEYIDSYIYKLDKTQTDVARENETEQHVISRNYPRLVKLPELCGFVGGEIIVRDTDLGSLLRRCRLPRAAIGVGTGKSTASVGRALSALERYDDNHELVIESFGGKEFVTTEKL